MKILDGNKISKEILCELREKVSKMSSSGESITMVDIQVGDDQASNVYIESKKKKFSDIGISFIHKKLDTNISEDEVIDYINKCNKDKDIDAIFVELPLPPHIDEKKVIDCIDYKKDVDGFNIKNVGALSAGIDGFYPCTAEGIVELLKRYDVTISGRHAVVIGRSNIVGKPVAELLLKENATVTICHSKTNNLKEITNSADILVVATGKKKSIDDTYVKDEAVVVDVGIHKDLVNGEKVICGDVDFDKVSKKASYITPVPGGVGPMTVVMLMSHVVKTKQNG